MDVSELMENLNAARTISTTNLPSQVIYQAESNSKTCEECLAHDGRKFDLDAEDLPQLPIHPNCRCKYIADDPSQRDVTSELEHYRIAENLQKLHEASDELANDLADQILKARNENDTLREQKLFLLFNGRYFVSSNGKLLLDAVSGRTTGTKSTIDTATVYGMVTETATREFNYSHEQQGKKNIGGLPVGLYYILSEEERSAFTSPFSHVVKSAGWGDYSWSLHPVDGYDMRGRGSFFVHGGREYGSAGCIDLQKNDGVFRKYFLSTKLSSLYVYVSYSEENVEIAEKKIRVYPIMPISY